MAKDFFEDMGRVFTETVEDIGRKTGEAVEVQKLKRKRSVIKRGLNDLYKEIGEKVYDKYKASEPLDPEFVDFCDEIAALQDDIREIEEEIGEIRGMEKCSNCDAFVGKDDVFCKRCGTPIRD